MPRIPGSILRDLRRVAGLLAVRVRQHTQRVSIQWEKQAPATWLAGTIPPTELHVPLAPRFFRIERLADRTQSLGRMALWEGYGQPGATRDSTAVRSSSLMGSFYSWLVGQRRPAVVVEFGTAFGVSGMYWLSGLEAARHGRLFTFEPNRQWAEVARANLSSIATRFFLTEGTFEGNVDRVLGGEGIDIAFIDAIHRSEFVLPQFQLVCDRLRRPALVLFDDINFSEDMQRCWATLVAHPEVASALSVNRRLGVVEVP
jgi:predicted O-methyltransferase YrrM